jgi:hypothetical protein
VSDVLNMISTIETSMVPLPRFGLDACPRALAATTAIQSAVATPRPRTSTAAAERLLAQHYAPATIGAIADAAGEGTSAAKWLSQPQTVHMTLTGAFGGDGDLGPHPAREPV